MSEEVAVPHTLAPRLQQLHDMMIVGAAVFRSHRLLNEFPVARPGQSDAKLRLVHSLTKQTIERFELADERSHGSSQFRTGSWLRGRLLLFDLGFYSYRRFTLIEGNGDFSLNRLKTNTDPRITEARREWRGRAVSSPDRHLQDVFGGLTRKVIDIAAEVSFKQRPYGEKHSGTTMEFRVVGVRGEDTDDYHLYITNLPNEFTPERVAALHGVRWEVKVLFRELKSIYGLGKFQTSNPAIVELLVVAAPLTLTISRALLGVFQRMHPETMFPRERWARTFQSFARLILEDLAQSFGHPPPNLVGLMFCSARQPKKSHPLLSGRVAEAFRAEVRA